MCFSCSLELWFTCSVPAILRCNCTCSVTCNVNALVVYLHLYFTSNNEVYLHLKCNFSCSVAAVLQRYCSGITVVLSFSLTSG